MLVNYRRLDKVNNVFKDNCIAFCVSNNWHHFLFAFYFVDSEFITHVCYVCSKALQVRRKARKLLKNVFRKQMEYSWLRKDSHLGQVLFTIFLNDLPTCTTESNGLIFAACMTSVPSDLSHSFKWYAIELKKML